MNAAAALLAASLGTFALRQISVRVLAHRQLPPAVWVALRHAALAVMAALVVSASPPTGRPGMPSLAAAAGMAATAIVARRTKRIAASIAIGIVTYAAARAIDTGP
jgi:branched-subunit amino acid transport protein